MLNVSLQLTHELAKAPTKGSGDAAGYDLYSTEEYELKPMERRLFNIRIKMSIPKGYYGRIAPKSGLAFKNGIDVLAGVIDSDYRGEVGVLLVNLSTESFKISPGYKIAQMIFEQCHDTEFSLSNSLEETQRNEGGFGSTGLTDEQRSIGVSVNKKQVSGIVELFQKTSPSVGTITNYEKSVKEREQNLK